MCILVMPLAQKRHYSRTPLARTLVIRIGLVLRVYIFLL